MCWFGHVWKTVKEEKLSPAKMDVVEHANDKVAKWMLFGTLRITQECKYCGKVRIVEG